MSKLSFVLMILAVIVAAGFTVLAFAGQMGSPILPLLALIAALAALVMGRRGR